MATSEKTALDLALDLSPYLGPKRWEQIGRAHV